MPDAIAIQISQAIVDELNAFQPTSGKSFVAKLAYSPLWKRGDGDTIYVIPAAFEVNEGTRDGDDITCWSAVGVFAAVDRTDITAVTGWINFTEKVCDHFRSKKDLDGFADAFLSNVEPDVLFDAEALRDDVFMSVLRLGYTTQR